MENKIARILVFALSAFALFNLISIPSLYFLDATAATSFGIDYRHLTTVSPGSTPNTNTTIAVSSGSTGTFIVDPYTSGSTATGTPSTTSSSGYGWRTAGIIGSSIPAGTWSFTVTTQATLMSVLANGTMKVYAYSTDTLGSNLSFIGSATGTSNVFSVVTAQTETITFSATSVDLTNKVLVVEYWIEVTTGPLLATAITFQANSSTQTVVLPSSSGTFYLGNQSLFSIGESESATFTEALSRSITSMRSIADSPTTLDSSPVREIIASRTIAEASGAVPVDFVTKAAGFMRQISDTAGAAASDSISRISVHTRQIAENSGVIVIDGISRVVTHFRQVSEASDTVVIDTITNAGGYVRQVAETTGAVASDSVSKFIGYTRNVSEGSGALVTDATVRMVVFARAISEAPTLVTDLLNVILDAVNPPPSGGGRGGGGGGGGGGGFLVEEPVDITPPIQNTTEIKNRHLNVRVADSIGIRTEENILIEQVENNATVAPDALNVSISVSLNGISTSFMPIPPTAVGSVTLLVVNDANSTENILLSFWITDNGTGRRLMEGTEEITLLPNQSFSKSLNIPFSSPGEYSFAATAAREDGGSESLQALRIAVSWISVYIHLLLTVIAAAIIAIDVYGVMLRRRRRKRSLMGGTT